MSQQTLADKVGVTRQTIFAIEKDKYSPSLEVAFKISNVFKTPLEDVFTYDQRNFIEANLVTKWVKIRNMGMKRVNSRDKHMTNYFLHLCIPFFIGVLNRATIEWEQPCWLKPLFYKGFVVTNSLQTPSTDSIPTSAVTRIATNSFVYCDS